MFSPTHTPPLESGSEDEGDFDLPDISVGTPKKQKKQAAAEPGSSKPPPTQGPSLGGSSSGFSAPVESFPRAFSPAGSSSTAAGTLKSLFPDKPADSPNTVREHLFKSASGDVRAMEDSIRYLSPVKMESSREINDSKRTAKKVKKLAQTLKEKTDREKKLEEFRSRNGIQGIAKCEEEKSEAQQMNCERSLPDVNGLLAGGKFSPSTAEDSSLFPSPSSNPTRSVFVRKPSLITEIYPPGIALDSGGLLAELLVEGNEIDMKNIVCGVMLPLSYVGRACPVELTQWLFQLMACSEDKHVSSGALRSLQQLLKQSLRQKTSFSPPTFSEITDVLVSLGADRWRLRPLMNPAGTSVQVLPPDQEMSVPTHPPTGNLFNLITYISACVQAVGSNYSVQQLEDLALVLCGLSLDGGCHFSLKQSLQNCLRCVLRAYPENVWCKAVARLTPQLASLSSHHHHHVLLARLLRGSTPRELSLLQDFCRYCLGKLVDFPSLNSAAVLGNCPPLLAQENKDPCLTGGCDELTHSDSNRHPTSMTINTTQKVPGHSGAFAKTILESYRRAMPAKMTHKDYHKLYCMLQLLNLQGPTFRSQSEQQEFLRVLGALRSTIRDDPTLPITSQVKDLLIRLKVELEAQGSKRGGTSTQLDLLFSS